MLCILAFGIYHLDKIFYNFGHGCYQNGNKECLIYLLKKADERNNSDAKKMLIDIFLKDKKYNEIIDLTRKNYDLKNPVNQFFIGNMYFNLKDYKNAFKWYLSSAKQGNSEAQYKLWEMNKNDIYYDENIGDPLKWLIRSAYKNEIYFNQVIDQGFFKKIVKKN